MAGTEDITTAEDLRAEMQRVCDAQFEAHKAFCAELLAVAQRSKLDDSMHDAVGLAVMGPHYARLEAYTPEIDPKQKD